MVYIPIMVPFSFTISQNNLAFCITKNENFQKKTCENNCRSPSGSILHNILYFQLSMTVTCHQPRRYMNRYPDIVQNCRLDPVQASLYEVSVKQYCEFCIHKKIFIYEYHFCWHLCQRLFNPRSPKNSIL